MPERELLEIIADYVEMRAVLRDSEMNPEDVTESLSGLVLEFKAAQTKSLAL